MVPGGNKGTTNLVGDAATINMFGIAEDPQGIKSVVIEGHVDAGCIKPDSSIAQQVTYYRKAENPDPGGQTVLTQRVTALFHQAADFTACNPGFVYVGHTAIYKAAAVNFSNTIVPTATYTISHKP